MGNYIFKPYWKVPAERKTLNPRDFLSCHDRDELDKSISLALFSESCPTDDASVRWDYPIGFVEEWGRLRAVKREFLTIITNFVYNAHAPIGNRFTILINNVDDFKYIFEKDLTKDGEYYICGNYVKIGPMHE